jgi:prephenate dehydrogenase
MKNISKVTIIGVGLIGGSIALSLQRKKIGEHICGVDEFSVIHRALERGAITEGYTPADLEKAVDKADIIFICTPINGIMETLQQLSSKVSHKVLICDVGSTKSRIVQQATEFLTDKNVCFLGTHPMAGSEKKGIDAADPYLFENIVWILTPYQKIPDTQIKMIGNLLENIGAKVLLLSPEVHDKIAAAVSHLPQMIAIALTNLIAHYKQENPNYIKLAAGGFRDMTRIASSPYSVWKDICETNNDQIARFIDEYIKELSRIKDNLLNHQLESDFEKAIVTRLGIPKDTKGFLKPAYDISVGVEDKPGVIAKISNILAGHNINIKDIEVLKVREGEGGTIRLTFASEEEREKAIQLIHQVGFSCYKRD